MTTANWIRGHGGVLDPRGVQGAMRGAHAIAVTLLALALLAPGDASAADAPEGIIPLRDYSGDLWSRSALTGDWGGWRSRLAENGVSVELDFTTMLPQSVVNGGMNTNTEVGTSMDLGINVDLMRMGLIPGGLLYLRVEGDWGDTINADVGGLSAANYSAMMPVGALADDRATISDLYYTQFLGESVGIFAGRIDTIKDANTTEFGGAGPRAGKSGFVNINLALQMVFPTTTPYVTALGAGLMVNASENLRFTAMFMDKQESSLDDNLGNLGDEGWNAMFGVAGTYELFGLPGGSSLAGAYAWDGDFTTVGEGQLNPIPPDPDLGSQDTSWAIAGTHWQYLWVFEDDVPAASTLNLRDGRPDLRGWGAFFMWGFADKDSNPFQWTLAGGIVGKGIVPGRQNDVLGLGYFYAELADSGVVDKTIGVRDGEQGFEIYYEAEVTPWLHLTPDLQVVRPGFSGNDTAVILGLRVLVDF